MGSIQRANSRWTGESSLPRVPMLRHPRLHHSRESNPLPKKTPGSPLTAHVPHLRFSFRSSSATGQYIYIQLVGTQRYLWLGEVMAELSDAPSPAPSCASDGSQYVSGGSCVDCPANSVSTGADATFCTCAANYWAKKSGNTWTCELCSGGRTKDATSTVLSGSGEDEDTVCVANCASNKYWDGDSCEDCPANSVGAGGTATACTCAANYWAKKSGNTWTCELCSGGRTKDATSTVLSGSGEDEDTVCVANCASNKYWDGSACEVCPTNSVGAGGAATTCTCAANYWAKKSGSTWSCELCSGQRTKDATSTVPGSGSSEDDDAVCVDATSCTANHYLSGGECVSCPTFDDKESTSASGKFDDVHVSRWVLRR